jgi:hypothetical protein
LDDGFDNDETYFMSPDLFCPFEARKSLGVKQEGGWPFCQRLEVLFAAITDESPEVIFIINL